MGHPENRKKHRPSFQNKYLVIDAVREGTGQIDARMRASKVTAEHVKNSSFISRVFELYDYFHLPANEISDVQVFHYADMFGEALEISDRINEDQHKHPNSTSIKTMIEMMKLSQLTADLAISRFSGNASELVLMNDDRRWLFDYHKDSKAYFHESYIRQKTTELKRKKQIDDETEKKIIHAYHTIFDITANATFLLLDNASDMNYWNQWMYMKKPGLFIDTASYLWLELTSDTKLKEKFRERDWKPLAKIIHGLGIAESNPVAESDEFKSMTSTGFSLLLDALSDIYFIENIRPIIGNDHKKKQDLIKAINPTNKLKFLRFLINNQFEGESYPNSIFLEMMEGIGFKNFYKAVSQYLEKHEIGLEYGFKSSLRTFLADWESKGRNYKEQLISLNPQIDNVSDEEIMYFLTKEKIRKFPDKAIEADFFLTSPIDFFRFRIYFDDANFNEIIASLSLDNPQIAEPVLVGEKEISHVHFLISHENNHIPLQEIEDPLLEIKKKFKEKNFSMYVVRFPINGGDDKKIFVEVQLFPKSLQRNVHRSRNAYVTSRFTKE